MAEPWTEDWLRQTRLEPEPLSCEEGLRCPLAWQESRRWLATLDNRNETIRSLLAAERLNLSELEAVRLRTVVKALSEEIATLKQQVRDSDAVAVRAQGHLDERNRCLEMARQEIARLKAELSRLTAF